MKCIVHREALPWKQREAIGRRVVKIRATVPFGSRQKEMEALALANGVSLRAAQRYARQLSHTCVCHICERRMKRENSMTSAVTVQDQNVAAA